MDVAVKLWDNAKNEVSTRYWNSSFLGRSTASDLLKEFKDSLGEIETRKLVQVSMDGPAVNWAFIGKLKGDMKQCDEDPEIVDVESCGLHVVHGAFQYSFLKSGWQIAPFLKSIYNVFKESPARRAEFTRLTESDEFPLKFCNCRWLENGPVCARAIKILKSLRTYFSSAKDLPDTWSIRKVKECLADPLLLAKLHFFGTIASSCEPFLKAYQTLKPVFPFLHGDVEDLLREVYGRFVNPEVLNNAKTAYKLINIDVEDVANGLKLSQINIGVGAQLALRDARVKDIEDNKFRLERKKTLVSIVKKLVEKSPIRYKFTKAASCLDPKRILQKPEQCKTDMDTCLGVLVSANHMTALQADRAGIQFKRFVSQEDKVQLTGFNRGIHRLDSFYASQLDKREDLKDVWAAVQTILLFSHGNAFVESGFSVNKDMLVENLHEDSLIALRRVWDGISHAGGEPLVDVDREMIRYARGASAKYRDALQKRRETETEMAKKSRFQREEEKRKLEKLEKLQAEKQALKEKHEELEKKIKKIKK